MFRFTSRKTEDAKLKKIQEKFISQLPPEEKLSVRAMTAEKAMHTTIFDNFAINQQETASKANKMIPKNKQDNTKGTFIFPSKKQQKSYYIIPSSKAGLMDLFEKYKSYEPTEDTAFKSKNKDHLTSNRIQRKFKALSQNLASHDQGMLSILNEEDKYTTQSSFHHENMNLQNISLIGGRSNLKESGLLIEDGQNLVQNKYKQTHRSCFRGASREHCLDQSFLQREHDLPGPGCYEQKSQFQKIEKNMKHKQNNTNNNSNNPMKSGRQRSQTVQLSEVKTKLSAVMHKIRASDSDQDKLIKDNNKHNTQNYQENESKHESFMFVTDQRDRFGENQYINYFSSKNPLYCPGPGQYDQSYMTIGNGQDKIERAKDQRKLLKEWLNPKQTLQSQQTQGIASQQSLNQSQLRQQQQQMPSDYNPYTQQPLPIYQFSYS